MIRLILVLVLLACYHNSICAWTYLLRAALVPPHCSPWQKLHDEGSAVSFLHIIGLTQEAVNILLNVFIPPDYIMCRLHWGRPWSSPPDGMLGLLCYLGSQKTNKWICLIFGITPSSFSHILKKNHAWQWGDCITIHLQEWHSQMRRRCGYIQTWSVSENQQCQMLLDSWTG